MHATISGTPFLVAYVYDITTQSTLCLTVNKTDFSIFRYFQSGAVKVVGINDSVNEGDKTMLVALSGSGDQCATKIFDNFH